MNPTLGQLLSPVNTRCLPNGGLILTNFLRHRHSIEQALSQRCCTGEEIVLPI